MIFLIYWICESRTPIQKKPSHLTTSVDSTAATAANDNKENQSSNEPSIRFKNGVPYHSVDLSASCPKCLAAAAEKPGSEGEFRDVSVAYLCLFCSGFATHTHTFTGTQIYVCHQIFIHDKNKHELNRMRSRGNSISINLFEYNFQRRQIFDQRLHFSIALHEWITERSMLIAISLRAIFSRISCLPLNETRHLLLLKLMQSKTSQE